MMSLNSLIIFSENPKKLVDFYKDVLQRDPDQKGGDFTGFQAGCGWLMIRPHDKVHGKNMNPERAIFNLETPDVEKEFMRLEKMGVKSIMKPYHPMEMPEMTLATLADPDGNYFQLASPMMM